MAQNSKIEWTDHTFNPWVGCTKIDRAGKKASACDFCYAEKWAKRSGQVRWGNNPRRRTTNSYWQAPDSWNGRASKFYIQHGRRQRVFCASLADVFDNQADKLWRVDLFTLIKRCSELDWLLLTKRPQNIRKMLPPDWEAGYPNVWLGTTAEDEEAYAQRFGHLSKIPAAVRFISYEPALGPLGRLDIDGIFPDWLIAGGESGVRADLARPTNPKWVRDAIRKCEINGVAPFLKQWGAYANNPLVVEKNLSVAEAMEIDLPENGKGGGKLDGKFYRRFPLARPTKTTSGGRKDFADGRRPILAGA